MKLNLGLNADFCSYKHLFFKNSVQLIKRKINNGKNVKESLLSNKTCLQPDKTNAMLSYDTPISFIFLSRSLINLTEP